MDWANTILEILKYVIPALIVFIFCYLVLTKFLDSDFDKKSLELRNQNRATYTPVKMQAYERIIIFLERINPSNLLLRINRPSASAAQLKSELVQSVNDEFNHNLAQQLYLSPQAWGLTKLVKEEVIAIINHCYNELDRDATGMDLSKSILERMIKNEEMPSQKAIDFLKKEFKLMFE